jgi:hypothetical protein
MAMAAPDGLRKTKSNDDQGTEMIEFERFNAEGVAAT